MAKLKLDPKRTALLIQDLQNDVMIEKGAFADSGAPQHAKEQNVVANVKRLATAFRKAGNNIHVCACFECFDKRRPINLIKKGLGQRNCRLT